MTPLNYVLNLTADNVIGVGMFILAFSSMWFTIVSQNRKKFEDLDKRKADKEYVDKQDRIAHHRIDELRADNKEDHKQLRETIKQGFDDLKDLIKATRK